MAVCAWSIHLKFWFYHARRYGGTLRQHRVCFSTGCRVHHARCPSKHEYLVSAVTFTQRQRLVLLDVDAVACLLANAARTTKPR
ncbi:Uncharacterised protein [Vibrio cholerae]|nr:Uncharacterised protein [Vibrio cholerae]